VYACALCVSAATQTSIKRVAAAGEWRHRRLRDGGVSRVCTSSIYHYVSVRVCVSPSRESNTRRHTAAGNQNGVGRGALRAGGGGARRPLPLAGRPTDGLSRAPTDASGGRAGARGANAIDVAAVAVPRDYTVQSRCCSGGVATSSTTIDTRR